MYECFHCGCKTVIWDADFPLDEYDGECDGIVHVCHCTNCGAEIVYRISFEDDDE